MTKARLADALLEAATAWQNNKSRNQAGMSNANQNETEFCWDLNGEEWDVSASTALSEVAGMGYDIVNASGTDCEKVADVRLVFSGYVSFPRAGHKVRR
jgi:hypothetical protein